MEALLPEHRCEKECLGSQIIHTVNHCGIIKCERSVSFFNVTSAPHSGEYLGFQHFLKVIDFGILFLGANICS